MEHVFKGTFLYTPSAHELAVHADSYLLVRDGKVVSIEHALPSAWSACPLTDFGNRFVIPGFTDIHFHAVQYVNRGLGHDKTLLDWLDTYTFPEEARFLDLDYARKVFEDVVMELWQNGSLHSVSFANISASTTHLLMDLIEQAGLYAYVGKVNMDRFGGVLTEDPEASFEETLRFLNYNGKKVKPIVTPRFSPSVSDDLLARLGALAAEKGLPVQSHLNETLAEVAWVKELFPHAANYLDTYIQSGLISENMTIMAHCSYNSDDELERMKQAGVMLAHCPSSNTNLTSGVMPVQRLLADGQRVGLGSDISGGDPFFMAKIVTEAVKASKLLSVLKALPDAEINEVTGFYLATKGGGDFFGATGSFEPGYAFDALVVDDSRFTKYRPLTPQERLTKWLYLGVPEQIDERYVDGQLLPRPVFS